MSRSVFVSAALVVAAALGVAAVTPHGQGRVVRHHTVSHLGSKDAEVLLEQVFRPSQEEGEWPMRVRAHREHLIVRATPAVHAEIAALLEEVDQPFEVHQLTVGRADAREVAERIRELGLVDIRALSVDERTNTLLVRCDDQRLAELKPLVAQLSR